jgi:hypothetical protein
MYWKLLSECKYLTEVVVLGLLVSLYWNVSSDGRKWKWVMRKRVWVVYRTSDQKRGFSSFWDCSLMIVICRWKISSFLMSLFVEVCGLGAVRTWWRSRVLIRVCFEGRGVHNLTAGYWRWCILYILCIFVLNATSLAYIGHRWRYDPCALHTG